jgi:hypothetical protein
MDCGPAVLTCLLQGFGIWPPKRGRATETGTQLDFRG